MIYDFVQGMILGFAAAVPLGPINLLIMNEALNRYKNGLFIGLGAMSADATYLLLILFGLSVYLKNVWLLNTLAVLGSLFLLYIAYLTFKNRNNSIKKVDIDKKGSLFKHYIKGYFLTLVNPFTSVFWLSIATLSINATSKIATFSGLLFAILLWISIMPYFVYKSRNLISQKVSSIISISSAIVFTFFAVAMIVKLIMGNIGN